MPLPTILERLIGIEGVRTIVVAGREGFVIARAADTGDDDEAFAAFGASALSAAEALGAETQREALISVILEYNDTLLSIDPLGELALTVAQLDTAAVLVPFRLLLRQVRGELLAALDAM
jgi:predicted regulator of Ras-like GTPase activity (Roadblock/LC7/MglB family)